MASPVHVLTFVQFTNLKPFSFLIDSYSVETEISSGNWIEVPTIDLRRGLLYTVLNGTNFTNAILFDLTGMNFNGLIENKTIPSHETVQGWMYFEIPTNGIGSNWRMRMKDSTGTESVELFQFSKGFPTTATPVDIQMPFLKPLPGPVNISTFRRGFYTDILYHGNK